MSHDVSVSDIVKRVRSDFSLSVQLDVTRIQDMFESLCVNVITLQNEIEELKKALKDKADKADLEPINNALQGNYNAHNDLSGRIDGIENKIADLGKPEVSGDAPAVPSDELEALKKRVDDCEANIKNCEAKFDDLKGKPKTPRSRGSGSEPQSPHKPSGNAEEMLDMCMDACKQEIAEAKLDLMKEVDGKIKASAAQIMDNVGKMQAETNEAVKKNSGLIEDLENKLIEDTSKLDKCLTEMLQKLKTELVAAEQRIDSIEERLAAMQTAPDMEALKGAVGDDGKVDSEALVAQMQALAQSLSDTNARVSALEKRETVSPERLDAMAEAMAGLTTRAQKLEQTEIKTELKLAQLNEAIEELKEAMDAKGESDKGNAQQQDVGDGGDSIKEQLVKCQRDILSNRAAIKTLRENSEQTRSLVDEANRVAYDVRTDMDNAMEKRKKLKEFVKKELEKLASQIKELQDSMLSGGKSGRGAERVKLGGLPVARAAPAMSAHAPAPQENVIVPVPEKEPAPVGITEYCDPPPPAPVIQPAESKIKEQHSTGSVTISRPRGDIAASPSVPRRKPLPRLGTAQGKREPEVFKSDLKKFDDLLPRMKDIDQTIATLKSAIEQLNKNTQHLNDVKADKSELQNVFDQFRMAMGEMNQRVGSLRKALVNKAESQELQELQKALMREVIATGETAAGAETVRCLMCGRPRDHVTGAIDDPDLIKQIGPAMSSRVTNVDGDGTACFVYGEHGEMFLGRSVDGRPIFSRREKERDSLLEGLPPPATAPTPTRRSMEVPQSA